MGLKAFFKGKNKKNREADLEASVCSKPLPQHVAIIMDGNGRWAKQRHLPRAAGHRQGVEALRDVIRMTSFLGIQYLTLYAFSTENWKRPQTEVNTLMSLLVEYLQREVDELLKEGVRIHVLGDIAGLPANARSEVLKAVERTRKNNKLQVNIAINYGSRHEILAAVKEVVQDARRGRITLDELNEDLFARYLDTEGIPDPDLLIRTSGECRLSNFLLYQSAYTELIFTSKDVNWPDFDRTVYLRTLDEYQNRQRRYGGLKGREDEATC